MKVNLSSLFRDDENSVRGERKVMAMDVALFYEHTSPINHA
jgi:hypothetical protein